MYGCDEEVIVINEEDLEVQKGSNDFCFCLDKFSSTTIFFFLLDASILKSELKTFFLFFEEHLDFCVVEIGEIDFESI